MNVSFREICGPASQRKPTITNGRLLEVQFSDSRYTTHQKFAEHRFVELEKSEDDPAAVRFIVPCGSLDLILQETIHPTISLHSSMPVIHRCLETCCSRSTSMPNVPCVRHPIQAVSKWKNKAFESITVATFVGCRDKG